MPLHPLHDYKQPLSALVVIHTPDLQVLLIERADYAGAWQSVTGSCEWGEPVRQTAIREVFEETGLHCKPPHQLQDWAQINTYSIYEKWRHRYPPDTQHNTEHVFSLCIPQPCPVVLAPREHTHFIWLPYQEAAQKVFSPSNAAAILALPERTCTV